MRRTIITMSALLWIAASAAEVRAASLADSDLHPVRRERAATARAGGGDGIYGRTFLRAHVGFSAPTGDFGDVYDSGPGFGGSIGYGVGRRVLLSFGIAYHHFNNQATSAVDASITPFTVDADYVLPSSGRVKPWIGGGVGMYHVKETLDADVGGFLVQRSASENNFGLNVGMGFGVPVSPRALVGAGVKYHQVWGNDFIDTPFFTFQVGMGFEL